MRRNIQVVITFLLMGVCCALRGEEAVDADALIAHVKEHIAYLESLYDKGIEIEYETQTTTNDDTLIPVVDRFVYHGLYELGQRKYLPEHEGVEEGISVRNPKYSFDLVKETGKEYAVRELYNDRDGILEGEINDTMFDNTAGNLIGVFILGLRLRDLFESDTFKAESAEKSENQYHLTFRSNVVIGEIDRVLGGELFFNADDYSLEEWKLEREIFIPDVIKKQHKNHTKYTYADWEGIKYPKLTEGEYRDDERTLRFHTTVRSFRLGPPQNKKEFYLKYYGIAEPDSTKQLPTPTIFIAVGLILIGMGIYLKRRAAAGERSHTNNGAKNDVHEI